MSDQIKLGDCPEILRTAVKAELSRCNGYNWHPEIISCTAFKSLSGADTTYTVYVLALNLVTILSYIAVGPERYDIGIIRNDVTIGDIKEILRAAPQYFK